MRKSARLLGHEFNRSAKDMNALLKEHGYLDGEPGLYRLTEKGERYGVEQDHHRGVGGYQHYNREWTTRTWEPEIVQALRSDIEAGEQSRAEMSSAEDASSFAWDHEYSQPSPGEYEDDDSGPSQPSWAELVVGAGVVLLSNREVRRWLNEEGLPVATSWVRSTGSRGRQAVQKKRIAIKGFVNRKKGDEGKSPNDLPSDSH